MKTYGIWPNDIENIRATPHNPVLLHKRPFSTTIAKSKDKLKKEDAQATKKIKVYLDRSALNGKVGVVAVLIRAGKPTRKLHFHLGPM